MNQKRLIIAGGSGFIGSALVKGFLARGYEVVVLTRSPRPRKDQATEVKWDGETAGEWVSALEGAEAVINLTGKNINCPHTQENLRELVNSRVNSVKALAAALERVKVKPKVWVQASAVGFYGDTGNVACDENSPSGRDDLADICRQWEAAFTSVTMPWIRKVTLRIGFVLGHEGGALPLLSKMTRMFLGGAAGNGEQYLSWIHLADLVAMFLVAVEDEKLTGVYNATAPHPVTNSEFMRELRKVLHRPWSPPAPEFAVKLGARLMGSEPTLVLVSQRCVPKRFMEAGFLFKFLDLEAALKDLSENA